MKFLRALFFNFWYFRRPPWDSGISPPELLQYLDTHPTGRAIDLGCGTGTNVITLARRGWQVSGVDFAPRAISIARHKARQAGVPADLHVGDVTQLQGISGPFTFALDLGCFHSLSWVEKEGYLRQLERILAPGGHWLLYTFLSEQSTPGLSTADLGHIQLKFELLTRQDGTDRGERHSAYFLFQKR